jgi:hypothetical protein
VRTNTSDSSLIRRFEYNGVVFEVSASLEFTEEDARDVLVAVESLEFTSRDVFGVRILSDHEKTDEPYNLSIVFDRHRKR